MLWKKGEIVNYGFHTSVVVVGMVVVVRHIKYDTYISTKIYVVFLQGRSLCTLYFVCVSTLNVVESQK